MFARFNGEYTAGSGKGGRETEDLTRLFGIICAIALFTGGGIWYNGGESVVSSLVYAIIGLVLLAIAVAVLAVQNYGLRDMLAQSEARLRSAQHDREIRRNLQRICTARQDEIRRLRETIRGQKEDYAALESELSQTRVELFNESGRRLVAEKEEATRRMRAELMEREMDDAGRRLKQRDLEAREEADRLWNIIHNQAEEIEKLKAQLNPPQASRRARRARTELKDQVTMDDLLGPNEPQ